VDEDATFLRGQAAKCRRLAEGIDTEDVAKTLTGMAADYEKRANEINERSARTSGRG